VDDTKSIFASKTAWLGAAVTMVGALQALNWAQLIPSGPVAGYIASGLGMTMIVLRFLTSKPATL
jgi:hypothetical protein